MKTGLIVIIIFAFLPPFYAQNKRIVKIIDSNLYMLDDSTFVKLAGIEIPTTRHANKQVKKIADEVFEYTNNNFVNRPLEILYAGESEDKFNSKLVIINKIFLLSQMNYNSYFIERGFGRFVRNSDKINDSLFVAVEKSAKENNLGVYRFKNIDSLDLSGDTSSLPAEEYTRDELLSMPFKYSRGTGRVLLEIPAGVAGAFLCSFAGTAIGSGLNKGEGIFSDEAAIGMFTGYIFGSSLGVYLVAKGGNKDLLLGYTALSSLAATAIAGGLYAAFEKTDAGPSLAWLIVIAPTAGAMIYANTLGYNPQENSSILNYNSYKSNLHSDFYSYNTVRFNLFKIYF